MALFNKLFNKRKLVKQSSPHTSPSQFPFSKDQVRVLLFRECDWRGRRLLFDSSALEPLTSTQQTQHIALNVNKPSPLKPDKNHVEYCDGKPYKYGRPNPDCKNFGEMVFGSVAISFRGPSFKIHWLDSPTRILCSQVFLAPVQPYSSASSSSTNTHSSSNHTHASSNYGSDLISDIGSASETNSLNSFSVSDSAQNVSLRTHPLDVPTAMSLDNDDFKFISQSIDGSSGYISSEPFQHQYSSTRSSLASIYSDIENPSRKMSFDSTSELGCELGRFNRRIMKNLSTSFENVSTITENLSNIIENNYYTVTGASNLTGLSDGCVSKLRRNSEVVDRRKATSGDCLSSNSSTLHHRPKRPRLAISVCITMSECMEQEMVCFCSEHMALIESMLYRLRAASENAYINRQNFLPLMIKAWLSSSQWMVDLFSAPRLASPVWLSLSTEVRHSSVLASSFMQDLMSLLNTADTKDTNFFISTLLTAVLTHHLGWVGTVAPLVTSNIRDSITKNGCTNPLVTKLLHEENLKLSEISKIYPYNALWAQLGDLYGAITNPIKLSKTIICGSAVNTKTIEKLLNILTYFIRCSEIQRNCNTKVFDKDEISKIVNQQINSPRATPNFQSSPRASNVFGRVRKNNGLSRTATTVKDLSQLNLDTDDLEGEIRFPDNFTEADSETYRLLLKSLKKNVMNDIPKVLAFRDSRMVKQELRIGNASMDTGIEMTEKDKQFLSKYQKNLLGDHIKFTVTRPDGEGAEEEELDLDEETDFKSQLDNFISLSNLITANSLGGAQSVMKMFWGKEAHKETFNIEQIKHLERLSAQIEEESSEKLRTIPEADDSKDVVFVLGDNEKLVGLKSSPSMQTIKNFSDEAEAGVFNIGAIKKTCKHNRKHSGVKFNFEKYPQIATNYMKSKNLEYSDYEVLEKGLKMEREQSCGASTSNTLKSGSPSTVTLRSTDDSDSEDDCECCRNGSGAHYLQTPSNATDLEFSGDQSHDNDFLSPNVHLPGDVSQHFQLLETLDENCELKSEDDMKFIEIPMLESVRVTSAQDEIFRPGFTSSLFTAASDHYIADMVLQGVTAPPPKWELELKQDLTVSSHCAVLEQTQAENVAIVANVDKWDVRLVSSHSNVLPSTSTANGIVGMSQLIASMLETVQAMCNSGLNEFQCLSYIESKLREIYLHSETLASFLLETEFCSLSTLTTALNLSVNDIPLLMSVASIHTPMISKKYGITFR